METRRGMTIVELLIAVGIVGILMALLLPAVQMTRASARRVTCSNHLRQLAIALQSQHDATRQLPPGISKKTPYLHSSWCLRIMPYLEREDLWRSARRLYETQTSPFEPLPHAGLASTVSFLSCPSDGRADQPQWTRNKRLVGLTNYLGVAGTNYQTKDGMLFVDSRVRFADVTDGTSYTLLLAERPPSLDMWFGWWYAGGGQANSGVPDMLLGARELNIGYDSLSSCGSRGPIGFAATSLDNPCSTLQFWSMHFGGAFFAYVDGAVRFHTYDSDDILAIAATRAGSEQ